MRVRIAGIAVLGFMAGISTVTPRGAAHADTFTWNPALASPALAGPGSAFTADGIAVTNYLHSVNTNDFVTLRQNFVEQFIQPITGFTLGGNPVTATGFNSSYGLYFAISATGYFPINTSGSPIGPATFNNLDMSLMADVNHDDGTVSSTLSGVAFSNPAGVLNDVTLATGSLVSAALSRNPVTNVRNAHFVDSFVPETAQAAFFVSPTYALHWDEFLTTLPDALHVVQVDPPPPDLPPVTTVQMVNGDQGSTGQVSLVPEPGSSVLLLTALAASGLAVVRRRSGSARRPPSTDAARLTG